MQKNEEKNEVRPFIPDSRFQALGKEAIVTGGLWLAGFLAMLSVAACFHVKDPTQYTYLLGLPLWFAICCIIQVAVIIVTILLLLFWYQDISLEPRDPEFHYTGKDGIN